MKSKIENQNFTVALTEPRRTEYLLRKSTTRAPIAHGIVSGVECARQLWLRFEEKETQKRPIARGFGRYNSLLCAFYSFYFLNQKKEPKEKSFPNFLISSKLSGKAFTDESFHTHELWGAFFIFLLFICCLV